MAIHISLQKNGKESALILMNFMSSNDIEIKKKNLSAHACALSNALCGQLSSL